MSETVAILGDLQIPWHDEEVVYNLVLPFLRDLKPDGVILNGDIVDCYAISDFDKNPEHADWDLVKEQSDASLIMNLLKPIKTKWWIGGNHEDRWRRIAWRNPALKGMLKSFPQAFSMDDYGFKWKPYGDSVNVGKLMVTHGQYVRKHSGDSGQAHYDRFGTSVLVNHTHRLGAYYRTDTRGVHGAWENGCLCSLEPEYAKHPDWQQGFSIVKVFPGGLFSVQQLPVINRRLILWGDKEFKR